jgi:hypothetical protein
MAALFTGHWSLAVVKKEHFILKIVNHKNSWIIEQELQWRNG